MSISSLPSERIAVVANIDPDAYTAATYTSDWVAMKDFYHFMAIVQAGDLGSSATLDAKLRSATSSAGAGAADITGAAITQLTQAGSDSNKQAVINFDPSVLAGTSYTHVQLSMTVGTATSDAGAVLLGFNPRNAPASGTDASTVDSITNATG